MNATDHTNVKTELHRAALDYASRGWPVFPILPGTKVPATDHGFHDASLDPAQIDAWWAGGDYNIGFSPHTLGLSVVDLDGPEAETNWAGLALVHGDPPETLAVKTPRGWHLYYQGELPPTQSKLAEHVDTRGRGSYALLPPSRTEHGAYAWDEAAGDIAAPVPEWVVSLASAKREKAKAAEGVQLDLPANIARARTYLQTCPPAIEGQMGDKQTFVVACDLANLGLSEETALELALEVYNPRCVPEWEPDELETKIANGFRYSENEAGSWATGSAADVFDGDVLGRLLAESAAQPTPTTYKRFRLQTLEERANLPPPTWLIPEMLPDKAVSMIYGPGGGGKTFITLRLGLDLAKAGKRVAYVMGEGGTGVDQRAASWKLLTDTPGPIPFAIMDEMPAAFDGGATQEALEALLEYKPDLVIFDTVAWLAIGLKENDPSDMQKVAAALTSYSRILGCAVLAIHHTGKDAGRGPRGSDALLFGLNAALEVESAGPDTMRMWVRRQKDAPKRKVPWAYQLQDIGPSAVAVEVDAKDLRAREERDDLLEPKKLAQYLREMGAIGQPNAVTSNVLAQHAIQHSTDVPDDPEVLQEQAASLARILAKRAKGPAAGLTYGEGDMLRWAIPT